MTITESAERVHDIRFYSYMISDDESDIVDLWEEWEYWQEVDIDYEDEIDILDFWEAVDNQ